MHPSQAIDAAYHVYHDGWPKIVGKLGMLPPLPGAAPAPVFLHEEGGAPQDHLNLGSPGGWDVSLVDTLLPLFPDLTFHHFKRDVGPKGTLYVYLLDTIRASPVATYRGRTRYFPHQMDAVIFDGLFYELPPFFIKAYVVEATGHVSDLPRHRQRKSEDYRRRG